MSAMNRRAILAGAAATAVLPAIAAETTSDSDLTALGDQLEKLIPKYIETSEKWARGLLAAKKEVGDPVADEWLEMTRAQQDAHVAALSAATRDNGCDAAQDRISELAAEIEPLVEEIVDAAAASLAGLRAKALAVLWEMRPTIADHEGTFDFPDDGGATRSLFDAIAEFTGLMPMVRQLEAQLADDAEARS
jgi:phage gp29-like protein